MRSLALLTVASIASAYGVVQTLPDGDAHADPRTAVTREVHSISIDGGRGLPVSALREVLETRIGASVDTVTLERDRHALERRLADRGYLAAEVAPPVVTFGPSGGAYVVFDVETGPLYHVRNVVLDGPRWNEAGVVPLVAGDVAGSARLAKVREATEATLARHGTSLRVELVVEPDHADAMIDVRYVTH